MIIIEIQYSNDGTIGVLKFTEADPNKAEQTYHTKLAAAAVSSVNVHTVVLLSVYGERIKGETYYHGAAE